MKDKDDTGIIRGYEWKLINTVICIDYNYFVIWIEKSHYDLIVIMIKAITQLTSYLLFYDKFLIIILISLQYNECDRNNVIFNHFKYSCVSCA